LSIVYGSTIVQPGDTVDVPCVTVHDTIMRYQAAPLLFFKKDATDLLEEDGGMAAGQGNTIASLRTWLADHPKVRLTITGSAAADEDASLAKKRIMHVADKLAVVAQRVTIVPKVQTDRPKHEQLLEEQRFVRVDIDGNDDVVDVDMVRGERTMAPVSVNAVMTLVCEAGPCRIDMNAEVDGRQMPLQGTGEFRTMVIMPQMVRGDVVNIAAQALVTDSTGRNVRAGTTANIRPTVKTEQHDTMFILRHQRASSKSSFLLGYSGFDEGSFYAIDQEAVAAVKAAWKRGKKITLYPGADDLGEPAHNVQLQRSRAASALRLLGLSEKDVQIVIEPSSAASNVTPMGRIANRSVRATISE
jgi:hypothetical protein